MRASVPLGCTVSRWLRIRMPGPVVVPGRPHDQVIAIAVLAGLALGRGAERAIGALDLGHHGLDAGEVGRLALDLDPGADALQDLGGAHRGTAVMLAEIEEQPGHDRQRLARQRRAAGARSARAGSSRHRSAGSRSPAGRDCARTARSAARPRSWAPGWGARRGSARSMPWSTRPRGSRDRSARRERSCAATALDPHLLEAVLVEVAAQGRQEGLGIDVGGEADLAARAGVGLHAVDRVLRAAR